MKKLHIILCLIALTIAGSLFTALASNMLFDDLFNKGVSFANMTIAVSLPAVSVATMFVLGVLYLLRTYKHPDCKKRITRTYLIIATVMGVIGLVGAILGGATIYHTFVGTHPFPGYLIIFMILNLLIIAGGVVGLLLYVKKMPEDEGKVKINFLYVLKTIGWVLFIGLVFNRFGMLLGLPSYVYLRNLYQTFPVYLALLIPLFLGVVEVLYILDMLYRKQFLILAIAGMVVSAGLFAYTAIMGINDTAFISSLSQIMPIERMASMPIEIIIHLLAYLGVGAAIIVQNRKPKEGQQAE